MQPPQTLPSALSRSERAGEASRQALPLLGIRRDPWPGHSNPKSHVMGRVSMPAPKRLGARSDALVEQRPTGRHPMRDATGGVARERVLRHSVWDGVLVALSFVHGALLLIFPSTWLIALGIWWNGNTISHNFIHLPFFRSRAVNRSFSIYLTVLLGIPQTLWRDRHLAHHANTTWKARLTTASLIEILLVVGLWVGMLVLAPRFFLATYLPGYLLGLGLCYLQGHYEHARGTTSHYGSLYNWLFFNDGFHVEHHARPALHWTRLRRCKIADAPTSRWPAVLRWLEMFGLDSLERLVVRSARLQKFVLKRHERAFRQLLAHGLAIRKIRSEEHTSE